jgi:hypothetical protein
VLIVREGDVDVHAISSEGLRSSAALELGARRSASLREGAHRRPVIGLHLLAHLSGGLRHRLISTTPPVSNGCPLLEIESA